MRCAMVNNSSGIVENVIVADPKVDPAPAGYTLVSLPDDSPVSIGWTYDGSSFTEPVTAT